MSSIHHSLNAKHFRNTLFLVYAPVGAVVISACAGLELLRKSFSTILGLYGVSTGL